MAITKLDKQQNFSAMIRTLATEGLEKNPENKLRSTKRKIENHTTKTIIEKINLLQPKNKAQKLGLTQNKKKMV